VVGFERVERVSEAAGRLLDADLVELGPVHLVDVLVDRRRRLDLVLDAVEAGHQDRRERQVRVGGRVRGAELDALGLGDLE
jgi:hypothetical protein